MSKLLLSTAVAVLIIFTIGNTYAQTCANSSVAGGTLASPLPWTSNSTWGTTAPSASSPTGNICIGNGSNTSIVSVASTTMLNWSSPITLTVRTGSTLIVTGDFTISNNLTVSVQSGATLKVNGALYTSNQGSDPRALTNLGTVTITGLMEIDGPGVITNGSASNTTATMTVGSTLNLKSSTGSSVRNWASMSVTGATTITNPFNNSGTYTAGATVTLTTSGFAAITNSGTLGITGSFSASNTVTNTGTINVSVDYTQGGVSTTSNGNLNVTGNVYATGGSFQLSPTASASSTMTINGSLTINANENMKVGTGSTCAASTYYANLIVKSNVTLIGSGDITVYSNGRLVVFGNIDGTTSSGTLVTVNCGGQAYVHGNVNLGTGGGNTVANANGASAPTGSDGAHLIGLYVNGTTTAQYSPANDADPNTSVGTKSQLQTNDTPFYNYIASITGSPMPVTLTYFQLKSVSSEGVTLEWQTASEINFDHFNLMRSSDGKNFQIISEIQGHGTTKEVNTYTFTDKLALSGKSYYKLQSVDFDGYTETFRVVSVTYESNRSATLYPNPVTGSNLTIELNFVPTTNVYVSVLNFSGSEVMHTEIKAGEVSVLQQMSIEPGVYMVRLSSAEIVKIERVVVK